VARLARLACWPELRQPCRTPERDTSDRPPCAANRCSAEQAKATVKHGTLAAVGGARRGSPARWAERGQSCLLLRPTLLGRYRRRLHNPGAWHHAAIARHAAAVEATLYDTSAKTAELDGPHINFFGTVCLASALPARSSRFDTSISAHLQGNAVLVSTQMTVSAPRVSSRRSRASSPMPIRWRGLLPVPQVEVTRSLERYGLTRAIAACSPRVQSHIAVARALARLNPWPGTAA
jgi:hypothetical protein